MIKVLHINRNYITSALHQVMINHFDSSRINNTVFAPTDNKDLSIVSIDEKVIVAECFKKIDRLLFDLKQYKIMRALSQLVNVKDFDLIHAYTLFTDGNTAMKLSLKYNVPYVVAIRNTDVNDFFKKMPFLRRRGVQILNKASTIFFLSDSYKNQVFDRYIPSKYRDEFESKTVIIPNGIDDFWLSNAVSNISDIHFDRLSRKHLNAVCAGRIDKNKNITSVIEALLLLEKKGWNISFTVVGKIEDVEEFKILSSYKFVKYIEPQKKEKLLEIYRANDIFIMPSYTESFGLVYAEAMTQGIPVIYTQNQGFDGQFPEGQIGYHVNPYSIEDIANAIERVIATYNQIAAECPRCAMKFNWENIINRYTDIYVQKIKENSKNKKI